MRGRRLLFWTGFVRLLHEGSWSRPYGSSLELDQCSWPDALDIEAQAKRRLADEYDAAQARGEVATARDGDRRHSGLERPPTAAEIGISAKEIFEAPLIRDAEKRNPGVVRKVIKSDGVGSLS